MDKDKVINFISYCLWSVAGAGLLVVGGMTAELALLGLIFFYLITFTGPLGVKNKIKVTINKDDSITIDDDVGVEYER